MCGGHPAAAKGKQASALRRCVPPAFHAPAGRDCPPYPSFHTGNRKFFVWQLPWGDGMGENGEKATIFHNLAFQFGGITETYLAGRPEVGPDRGGAREQGGGLSPDKGLWEGVIF